MIFGLGSADGWTLVGILILLVVLAFLAVAETSITRISTVKAQAMAVEHGRRGRSLARLVSDPARFLNPVLLVVNICQTAQAVLVTILAQRVFGAIGVLVGFVLNVLVMFVLAEAVPKTFALTNGERAALMTARPVSVLVHLAPLRILTRSLIGLANVIAPGKGLKKGPFVSEQELLGIVDAAAEDEVIEREERELIESVIEFGDTVAREIMVPRPDMVTVPATATITEALDTAIEHGYSRVPVVGEGIDDVLGVAYTKDLMRSEREGRGGDPVVGLCRKAQFVPETKPVARLMREMQAEKFHMALLVDEYGGIAGLITLEDLIEELVGEIVDEYDVEGTDVEHLADDEFRVDGGLGIGDLNELLPIDVPDDDWDTVGGFVFATLGHVPSEGESLVFNGHRFTADRIEGRRISSVLVTRLPDFRPDTDDEDEYRR